MISGVFGQARPARRQLVGDAQGVQRARHGIAPARHYQLHEYGVKKRTHQDFDPAQAAAVLARIETDLQEHPVAPAHA